MSGERARKPLDRIGLEVLDTLENQSMTLGVGVIAECRWLRGNINPRLEQRRSLLLPSASEMAVIFEIAQGADAGELPVWNPRRGAQGWMPIEHPAAEYEPVWDDGVIRGVRWTRYVDEPRPTDTAT
ncbi:hypothetical protein [Sorangium sp. So ce233]|uniref:hypothetical protein n=1 Tax=Sorangium sp. So ce233 TaxID=3133290 RepID=UPI003F614682